MEVNIAVAKIRKYATSTSGDTVEVTERPNGGVSVVLADGQSSGKGAKWVSTFVTRKVISLLAEGVRDGAAARAASDALFTERGGKVSATLNIFSVDMQTNTLVISRNNPAPVILIKDDKVHILQDECIPIGYYRGTRPCISEINLEMDLVALMFTDGIIHAGKRSNQPINVVSFIESLIEDEPDITAKKIADMLLEYAITVDQGRPADDISVVALRVEPSQNGPIRRMTVQLPLDNL